jgi:hypothetical protein
MSKVSLATEASNGSGTPTEKAGLEPGAPHPRNRRALHRRDFLADTALLVAGVTHAPSCAPALQRTELQSGSKTGRTKENGIGALDVQLTRSELGELDTAFSKLTVHGGRMSEKQMRDVDQTP